MSDPAVGSSADDGPLGPAARVSQPDKPAQKEGYSLGKVTARHTLRRRPLQCGRYLGAPCQAKHGGCPAATTAFVVVVPLTTDAVGGAAEAAPPPGGGDCSRCYFWSLNTAE
jgi:hypothetical protein